MKEHTEVDDFSSAGAAALSRKFWIIKLYLFLEGVGVKLGVLYIPIYEYNAWHVLC